MNVAYVRVSTVEQNEARQIEALEKHSIDKWFTEKVSGKNMARPELNKMLEYVREGDTIFIHDFSRLARSTADLLTIVEELNKKNVGIVSNKESIDSRTPQGKLMLTMIGAINEFERTNLLERQREGIAIQKELDKSRKPQDRCYKGRKAIDIDTDTFNKTYAEYSSRKINKSEMARQLNISRPTLDKLIKEHQSVSNAECKAQALEGQTTVYEI
jgi:DNA invertase Pin-like site-specific DNA recombinase